MVSRDRAQTAYLSGPCDAQRYDPQGGPDERRRRAERRPGGRGAGHPRRRSRRLRARGQGRLHHAWSATSSARPSRSRPPGGPVDLDEAHELVVGVEEHADSPLTALAWHLATGEVTWRGAQGAGTTWIPFRFSPDGLHLLAAADDGTGQRNGLLDAATGAYLSDFELPPDVAHRRHGLGGRPARPGLGAARVRPGRSCGSTSTDGSPAPPTGPRVRRTTSPSSPDRSPARLQPSSAVSRLGGDWMEVRSAHTGQHTHRSGGDHGRQGRRPRRRVLGVHGGTPAEPAAYGVPAHRRPAHRRGPGADGAREAVPVLGQGRSSATPSTRYVRRILVNEHNSLWRRGWKKREHATDVIPESQHTDTYDEGQRGALWEIVQTLPRKARAVVVLRYYEQLSEAETADALGISVGTVKSQASRALATLRATRTRTPAPPQQRGGAMNTNHDELERLLGDELNDRAGDIGGARLHLSDVRGRATLDPAHSRRGGTLGAAAVAAAVVVPGTGLAITDADACRRHEPDGQPRRRPGRPRRLARTTADARRPGARRTRRGRVLHPVDGGRHARQGSTRRTAVPGAVRRPARGRHVQRPGLVLSVVDGTGKLVRVVRRRRSAEQRREQRGGTASPGSAETAPRGCWRSARTPPAPTTGASLGARMTTLTGPQVDRLTPRATASCCFQTTGVRGRHRELPDDSSDAGEVEFEGRFVKRDRHRTPATGLVTVQTESNRRRQWLLRRGRPGREQRPSRSGRPAD